MGKGAVMTIMRRRSVLRGSLAAVATSTLVRPYLANAAATTATVWWAQGFAQEEDVSGHILSSESGSDWCHLMVPCEYDWPRHCVTTVAQLRDLAPEFFQNRRCRLV